jgi:phosphoglycerate kinase
VSSDDKLRSFKTLDDLGDLTGKRALVRADLNVPFSEGRVPTRPDWRPPCRRSPQLADAGAVVLVLSHFGRPKSGPEAKYSLKPVADALAGVLGRPVAFVSDCVGDAAREGVEALEPGQVGVLENTRFTPAKS